MVLRLSQHVRAILVHDNLFVKVIYLVLGSLVTHVLHLIMKAEWVLVQVLRDVVLTLHLVADEMKVAVFLVMTHMAVLVRGLEQTAEVLMRQLAEAILVLGAHKIILTVLVLIEMMLHVLVRVDVRLLGTLVPLNETSEAVLVLDVAGMA